MRANPNSPIGNGFLRRNPACYRKRAARVYVQSLPPDIFPMTLDPTSLPALIHRLPKVELHVHLEGSVRPETLRELSVRKGRLHRETEKWIRKREQTAYHYPSFGEFLDAFKHVSLLLETPQDYALIATRLLEWLAEQNVRYAEIIFAAGVVIWKRQPVDAVFEAVVAAADEARSRLGIRVGWIFDAIRHFGVEHVREVMKWAAHYRTRGAVALGIGGDEARGPASLFPEVFREARDQGLHGVAHAGEAVGPESIRAALNLLHVERIGHGLTAARDPELLRELCDRQVPMEVCPSSNVCTGLVANLHAHPLPKFLQAGLLVTLNSDDPAMFGTSLEREFMKASEYFNIDQAMLLRLCENAVRASFQGAEEKRGILAEIQRVAHQADLAGGN